MHEPVGVPPDNPPALGTALPTVDIFSIGIEEQIRLGAGALVARLHIRPAGRRVDGDSHDNAPEQVLGRATRIQEAFELPSQGVDPPPFLAIAIVEGDIVREHIADSGPLTTIQYAREAAKQMNDLSFVQKGA